MEDIFLLKDEEEEKKRIKIFSLSLSSKVGQELFHKIQNFPTIKKVTQFHKNNRKKNVSYNYKSLEVFFFLCHKEFLRSSTKIPFHISKF